MAKKIRYKVNEWGESVTFCPMGFVTFRSGRRKRVGDDCRNCRYKGDVDRENKVVECLFVKYGRGK
jgi:hypothetical protein